MRNTSALHWTLLVALLASTVVASAQRTTDDQEPVASPPSPTITTIAQSEQIGEYVRGLFQDRDGNLWFSTSHGICSYDGKYLRYFTRKALKILQDKNGAIWFAGTVDAVSRILRPRRRIDKTARSKNNAKHISTSLDTSGCTARFSRRRVGAKYDR